MWKVNSVYEVANTLVLDRYLNSKSEIGEILAGLKDSDNKYRAYFLQTGAFLLTMMDHYEAIQDEGYFDQSFDELLTLNHQLYEGITEPGYQTSFANPSYACEKYGVEMGRFLSSVAYMARAYVGLVYEGRIYDMNELNELFLLTFSLVGEKGAEDMEGLHAAVRDHLLRDIERTTEHRWLRTVSSAFDTYSHIVDHYDLTDLRYLFRYGMYVDTNEIEQAKHVLSLPEEKQQRIADTFTEAFVRGFVRNDVPLAHKKSVLVTYHLGFEAIVKKAYANFETIGLKPFVFYHLRGVQRPRLYNTKPNKQMEYDHRFSDAIFLDSVYVDTVVDAYKKVLKKYEETEHVYAGPALFEIFGEEAFEPVNHDVNMTYDKETSDLQAKLRREIQTEYSQYLPGDAFSFTINDYPLPSIGKDYKAIFDATIEVNTLDEPLYEGIQEKIIDALDLSEYVVVKGREGNETNIKVRLYPITDPVKQTKFDNCTADVNVPVGEVYTSPVLKGTEGLLHVKEVFLTGLKYSNLKLWFEDGMITDYSCSNFDTVEENKNFVQETLLHPYETLPLGEFAIGTNTVAYMMGKKFDIQAQLPILIGEKTGPHFAIGDTCFTWSEDTPIYNSNGKEVMARENEKTCQRKDNVEEAYTYRHTDITIPYNELDTIIGYDRDGTDYELIRGGRFVLTGTELLNVPFDEE